MKAVRNRRSAIQRDQCYVSQKVIVRVIIIIVIIVFSSKNHEQLRFGLGAVVYQTTCLTRGAGVALLLRQLGTCTEEQAELSLTVEGVEVAATEFLALCLYG